MKNLMLSITFLITLCIQQAHASYVDDVSNRQLSVSALKAQVIAPRYFAVAAYVITKDDTCPPCPPDAVCETCAYGIYVADDNRPRTPGVSMNDGIYLQTNKAREFQIGTKYLFTVRYRLEKNAAGAWQQTGPEFIDAAPVSIQNQDE
jgi:hypothetical protein